MKKLGLLVFVLSVMFIAFTGTNCKRKTTVIPITDTIVKQVKDTSGQTLIITVKDGITATAKPVPNCFVVLINNFDDFNKFISSPHPKTKWPAKKNYRIVNDQVDGTCEIDTIRPATGTPFPGKGNSTYTYHLAAFPIDPTTGDTNWTPAVNGAYTGTGIAPDITIAINGKKQVTMVVNP